MGAARWTCVLALLGTVALPTGAGASPGAAEPQTWCGVREAGAPSPLPPRAAGPPGCFGCGEPSSYTSFHDGRGYTGTRYVGRFVELFLPDAWTSENGLDEAARRLLLERADFVYAHARELMGQDPAGDGPLTIAVVDTTCGYGCGNIGRKGIEIVSTDVARDEVRDDLAAGVLPRILVHEMAHNFDLLNRDLWEGAGSTFDFHAWTSFFEQYLQIYTRMGSTTAPPDDVQASWIRSTFGAYLADPAATFTRCIAETACGPEPGTADRTWGGVTHRFVQLQGPTSGRALLATLPRVRARNGPPASLQDRADLHFEAMAEVTGTDLRCYADAWRWSLSAALAERLSRLPADPHCFDVDGDGTSPLLGDCDDDVAQVAPGAKEAPNGRDDDCNGVVDDVTLVEPPGSDLSQGALTFPGRAVGSITAGDADGYLIENPSDDYVAFELCSQGFQGWLFVYDGESWLGFQYTARGQCNRRNYRLTKGRWRVGVELNTSSEPGDYTLSVGPGQRWPATPEPAPAPDTDECRLILVAADAPGSRAGVSDRTRFWSQGTGFVAETAPGATRAAFETEPGVKAEFSLRTQAFSGLVPVGDWSAPRSVSFAPAEALACGQDPDLDGRVNGRDVCPDAADPAQSDGDDDGVGDACDVCVDRADGPLSPDAGGNWQRDGDRDGYGNVCDPDLNGDEIVDFRDLAQLKSTFFRPDASADLNGDGVVNFRDLALLKTRLFLAPGPSAFRP